MRELDVRERAFAMPLTSPAYPPGPYRFVNREYMIITYRTDPAKLRAIVPEPLEFDPNEPLVKYEFIRMPDSTGFGDYTESGQVIPVSFRGRKGGYTHCMFLNDEPPIAGGREIWGFPKKLAAPTLHTEVDALVGTLDYGPLRVATGTMGYKHRQADLRSVKAALEAPNFLLKIIPHVDGTPRICELVEYYLEDIRLKGAWTGPAALSLVPHALAPVAELPVLEIVSAVHILADLTLGLGTVVHDYLQEGYSKSHDERRQQFMWAGALKHQGSAETSRPPGKTPANRNSTISPPHLTISDHHCDGIRISSDKTARAPRRPALEDNRISIAEDCTSPERISKDTVNASRHKPVTVYDPKLLSRMRFAFERACSQLPSSLTQTELSRETVARCVLVHVDRGERRPQRLAYLAARDVRRHMVRIAARPDDTGRSESTVEETYSARASTPRPSSGKLPASPVQASAIS